MVGRESAQNLTMNNCCFKHIHFICYSKNRKVHKKVKQLNIHTVKTITVNQNEICDLYLYISSFIKFWLLTGFESFSLTLQKLIVFGASTKVITDVTVWTVSIVIGKGWSWKISYFVPFGVFCGRRSNFLVPKCC